MATLEERIEKAESETNTSPTEKQKESGRYKKGKILIRGLSISIENPKDSYRSGISDEGIAWVSKINHTYGFFIGTIGKDGDPVDVFIGQDMTDESLIYIIDQVDRSGSFDEHKVMLGFSSEKQAKSAYMSNYEKNWYGFGEITTVSLSKFKNWVYNKNATKHPASKLSMSKKIDFKGIKLNNPKVIELKGEVIEGETLNDLKKQAGDEGSFDSLILEIASPGGSVSEGLEIMVWLDKLSSSGKEIATVVVANAYSIASLIMLAADIRMISKHGEVMVHNPMVPELKYVNADELETYASTLRGLEGIMYELYESFTGLTRDSIKLLMDNETYLSPQESIENGFADMVIDIDKRSYEMMAVNDNKKNSMSNLINALNRVIGMVNKSEFVNQIYYNKESGEEIEVFQKDPSSYAVGDKTSIKEGTVQIADGTTLLITDYVISGIDKTIEEAPVEETEDVPEDAPEVIPEVIPEEEIAEELLKASSDEEVVPMEKPMEKPMEVPEEEKVKDKKDKDSMPARVIETTESITTKETIAKEKEDKEEIKVPEDSKAIVDLKNIVSGLVEKIESLEMKVKAGEEFEVLATKAIEEVASNTLTSFKPEARVVEPTAKTGSIFTRMKAQRGL